MCLPGEGVCSQVGWVKITNEGFLSLLFHGQQPDAPLLTQLGPHLPLGSSTLSPMDSHSD